MARTARITAQRSQEIVVRLAQPELDTLLSLLQLRYPNEEWATFLRFGWRECNDALLLTLAQVDVPRPQELDEGVAHVAVDERYTLRVALQADSHPLAIGIAHSHPVDCPPIPSPIDDDMDTYYAGYFADFAPNRPYVSLITSQMRGELAISGRVFWKGAWHKVTRLLTAERPLRQWTGGVRPEVSATPSRMARVESAFGIEAAQRLRESTVAVIGVGGTGSAVAETLARGGVGRIVVVDPDLIEDTNLERVHGAFPEDVRSGRTKVAIARDHINRIDPDCTVLAVKGSLPQSDVIDAIVSANVVIGCTDQQHSRLALSDICTRYLIPGLDCGVALEGRGGNVSGQIVQLLRMLPADPCAHCRDLYDPIRVTQELMSPTERMTRQRDARAATSRGADSTAYWRDVPQLNTVGYLTTLAGALTAGYAIGWLSGRFSPPFARLQLNLVAPLLDVIDVDLKPKADCVCRRVRGWADQGMADAFVTSPNHWPPVIIERDA